MADGGASEHPCCGGDPRQPCDDMAARFDATHYAAMTDNGAWRTVVGRGL